MTVKRGRKRTGAKGTEGRSPSCFLPKDLMICFARNRIEIRLQKNTGMEMGYLAIEDEGYTDQLVKMEDGITTSKEF